MFFKAKGQLISKCPYEKSVSSKIPMKIFLRFMPWKFTTSRLKQKESLCSVCKKIDSVFTNLEVVNFQAEFQVMFSLVFWMKLIFH